MKDLLPFDPRGTVLACRSCVLHLIQLSLRQPIHLQRGTEGPNRLDVHKFRLEPAEGPVNLEETVDRTCSRHTEPNLMRFRPNRMRIGLSPALNRTGANFNQIDTSRPPNRSEPHLRLNLVRSTRDSGLEVQVRTGCPLPSAMPSAFSLRSSRTSTMPPLWDLYEAAAGAPVSLSSCCAWTSATNLF